MNIPEPVLLRLLSVFSKDVSIEKVYLFGSRAIRDNDYNSDIDLALLGKNIKSSIVLDIQEAAGLYKVDGVNLTDNLDRGFIDELEKDAVAALLNAK